MTYTHRNGERTPPTEDGAYWFIGALSGRIWNYVITVMFGDMCKIDDEWPIVAADCDGQWWGPLPYPAEDGIDIKVTP